MMRLLLVDDEESSSNAVRLFLQHRGHEVRVSQSAHEALEQMREFVPDVVLSDWVMPGNMDGLDLAAEVHRIAPGACFVLVTGMSGADLDSRLEGSEIDHVLYKPVGLHDVAALLGEVAASRGLG